MAISLKHVFQSALPDGPDPTLVRPSNWNDEHNLIMATARIIGRTNAGTGPAQEISIGSGLTLAAGVLSASGGGTGTVTSVDVSGGTTGLSFTGGPITTSGTITMSGTLGVANGGTGQTTYTNGQLLIGNSTGNTLTKATLTAGTGVSITNGAGSITITNSAPDQTVVLTAGTGISTSGSYPNFTITNSAPDQTVALTGAGTTSISGTYPNFTITSNDQFTGTVTSVGGTGSVNGITLTGTVTSSGSLTLGGTLSNVSLTTQVTGTLPTGNGGTGVTGTPTNGQLLIGNGTGYTLATLTAGTGVSITNAAGSITIDATSGGGTVTTVSVVSANGFAGSVANATTTPAITLSTSVSGIVKGNGTALSAASAGTDYVAPGAYTTSGLTMATARLLGRTTAGTGAAEEITVGSGLSLSGGTLTATGGSGTVTSVDVSGGTTGLTFSGGPVTTSGTITMAGTLGVGNGGTGAATLTGVVIGNGTSAFTTKTNPAGAFVGTTDTQTLTNKTISVDNNTVSGIAASSFVLSNASGNIDGAAAQKAIPTGVVVGTTDTQTLTNKTVEKLVLNDGYTEEVFAITDGATVNLDPNNGSIQTWTLGANRTPGQANWAAGQSITLMVDDGSAFSITWSTLAVVWKSGGGTAPTLNTSGFTVIVLWKVGTTIYGARVGDA